MKIESSNFSRLIGTWNTTGKIYSEEKSLVLTGTDSYEFILNGNCILHKAKVNMGDEELETFELILPDTSLEKVAMHYYNSKGETGAMKGSLARNEFKIENEALKFEGRLNKENSKLIGKWYRIADDNSWTAFIDLTLSKQTDGKQQQL